MQEKKDNERNTGVHDGPSEQEIQKEYRSMVYPRQCFT